MKWLLITTTKRTPDRLGSNPGDEFAYLGIERLVRETDASADILRFDKESTTDWDTHPGFDRLVICGMPMFWSNREQLCSDIYWWDYLWGSYMTHEPSRVLPFGIGHVLVGDPADPRRYREAIDEVTSKSWYVVAREPIHGAPDTWINSVCPSVFCKMTHANRRLHRLCNFMETGGHFGYLTPDAQTWNNEQARPIADVLRRADFTFVAHTKAEAEIARQLGWPTDRIHLFDTAQAYLDLYADADFYFGNRMHGAAVAAGAGARTWGLTHDSRLGMVDRLGGRATRTTGVTPEHVEDWLKTAKPAQPEPRYSPSVQYQKMSRLLKLFAWGNNG